MPPPPSREAGIHGLLRAQEKEDISTLVNCYLVSRDLEASPRKPCFRTGATGKPHTESHLDFVFVFFFCGARI